MMENNSPVEEVVETESTKKTIADLFKKKDDQEKEVAIEKPTKEKKKLPMWAIILLGIIGGIIVSINAARNTPR